MGLTCKLVGHDWDTLEWRIGTDLRCKRCGCQFKEQTKHFAIGQKGLSNTYALLVVGFVGIAITGFAWAIADQIIMGDLQTFATQQQLSGTYLSLFSSMWLFIPVAIVIALLVGVIVTAHKDRNEI